MRIASLLTLLAAASVTTTAFAQIPYPNAGTPNAATYTFTAAANGNVVGYFAGSGASYDEQVGLLVNGVLTGAGYGLDDHSSVVGDAFNFGPVLAGDSLVFVDRINGGSFVYSDPSLNGGYDAAGNQHVYSTGAAANEAYLGSPAGTYVGFEDLPFSVSDFNYFDDTFVFTNVATRVSGVPDATSTFGLVGAALTGLGLIRRRRR